MRKYILLKDHNFFVVMFNKIPIVGVSLALFAGFLFANYAYLPNQITDTKPDVIQETTGDEDLRVISNNAFSVGEKLSYDLDWGPSTVGTATISIPRVINRNGRDAYEVRSRALSNKLISTFYPVDDQIVTYIDVAGIFSLGFEKILNEGSFHRQRSFVLDQENHIAYSKRDTVTIPEYCQDMLSAFFYVRTQDLKIGSTIEIPNYDNDKIYDLVVEVQKKQQVRVPAGKFNCIVVEPKLKTQGLFKHQGKIHVYLTDDERKIPVLMVSKVIFGQIAAKLTKIETEVLP
jgi:hypothetical protein